MLTQLYIKNFTLIDSLDIPFHKGFSVITGETGAGKSIILGAIGLLLGQRADSKTIKQGAEKCVIEAHFDLSRYQMQTFFESNEIEYDAHDCIIRRELTAAGKSRAFINDTPVALTLLKELGERLVDVHSQHQNLLLNKQDFQLSVVDIIANDQRQLEQYKDSYQQYLDAKKRLEEMTEEIERSRAHADFLQFQYNELSGAQLSEGEQEELEQRSETMAHAEEIKGSLYTADHVLTGEETGVVGQLKAAATALHNIENVYSAASELAQRMDSCYIEIKDIAQEISGQVEDVDFNPSELDAVNNRLDTIYTLEKKYQAATVAELLVQQEELKQKLSQIENSEDCLDALRQEMEEKETTCHQYADKLSQLRRKTAQQIEKDLQKRLVPLGMPHVRFEIQVSEDTLGRNGQDKISFLFSANTSTPLQPVAQVASGGEIARVMLALKAMISGAVKLPTIIFDEIDTGVSGKIAEKMAEIMQEMGENERQVISITHLPQIAALGSTHYKVLKEETSKGTTSRMELLTTDERISEIAQMLSGSDISDAAIANAKQLLKIKQ